MLVYVLRSGERGESKLRDVRVATLEAAHRFSHINTHNPQTLDIHFTTTKCVERDMLES